MKNLVFELTRDFVPFPKEDIEQSIADRFEKIVRLHANRLAVKVKDRSLTYESLNQAANRIAHAILAKRGQGNEPIALLFGHDMDVIAAALGVAKAGKIFLPVDPSLPLERIEYVLEDSQARLIVTNSQNLGFASKLKYESQQLLNIDELDGSLSGANPTLNLSPDTFSYLIYTSGSTGKPKGVVQNHLNTLHEIMACTNSFQISAQDRMTLLASLSSGQGIKNAFCALLNGSALYPLDIKLEGVSSLGNHLTLEEITLYHSSAGLFRSFLKTLTGEQNFARLRLIRLASQQVLKDDVELYKKHFSPHCIVVNALSSTETGTFCCYFVNKETVIKDSVVPVGYALGDKQVLLLDDYGQEVGFNRVGEIAVKSRYISPGYWRRPNLTQSKFLPDANGGDERVYLTGDLGRMTADGCLIYLGRKDFRAKIRGYSVELSEIERALLENPYVKEAAVVAWDNGAADQYLAAYVVPQKDRATTVSELLNLLRKKLPDYMLPSAFMFVNSLPQTNGKVDRRALPRPGRIRPNLEQTYRAATNEVEQELVQIWERVLDISPVGIHDNFFDLGGHSLLATQLITRVDQEFDVDLSVPFLFESPTIAQIAARLTAPQDECFHLQERQRTHSYLVKLQSGHDQKTVFCFPYAGGFETEYAHFARLARLIGPDYSFYGLRTRGTDGISKPHHSVEEMVEGYLKEIETVQPHGPYFLIGECGGGPEAYETARQLRARGEKIALLAFLDTRGGSHSLDRYLGRRLSARVRYHLTLLSHRWPREYLKARISFHLTELRRLRPGRRLLYLLDKTSKAVSVIAHALHGNRQSVGVTGSCAERQHSKHLQRAQKAYQLAKRRYRWQSYDGRITIIANEEWYRADQSLGWAHLIGAGLEVHKIPGNHNTYLLDHLQLAADKLKACLEKAEIQDLK